MKVLSLIEPFATLIKEKKNFIKNRSWKTNYRGTLYIHASKTRPSVSDLENVELMSLIEDRDMNFGFIICKCNLVDCVYMTEEYVHFMKHNNHQEYICGDYSVGRYAWVLEDIEPLDFPIKAKGQLNVWDYYDEFDVMKLLEPITYGWVDQNGDKHKIVDESYSDHYLLQSPKEVIKSKVGVCWDQVELERYYFKGNDWNIRTFFIVHYDGEKCPCHTFLTFEKKGKYYWFEHTWGELNGIYEYSSIQELLFDVKRNFVEDILKNQYVEDNLQIHEYNQPKYHISVQEFYRHCEDGLFIELSK